MRAFERRLRKLEMERRLDSSGFRPYSEEWEHYGTASSIDSAAAITTSYSLWQVFDQQCSDVLRKMSNTQISPGCGPQCGLDFRAWPL
jgi:hypothetical protein